MAARPTLFPESVPFSLLANVRSACGTECATALPEEEYFAQFDRSRGGVPSSSINLDLEHELKERYPDKTPPIAHWIWLGSSLHNEKLLRNMSRSASVLEVCTKILWTDQESLSDGIKSFCIDHEIKVIFIDDFFGHDGMGFQNRDLFELERFGFPPNYGAASDLLRYELLYKFGGIYLDADIDLAIGAESVEDAKEILSEVLSTGEGYGHYIKTKKRFGNDLIVSPPGRPEFKKINDSIRMRYTLSCRDLDRLRVETGQTSLIKEVFPTVYRSGPLHIQRLLETEVFVPYPQEVGMISANVSWLSSKWTLDPTEENKHRLVKQILFDIKREKTSLPYERYVAAVKGDKSFVLSALQIAILVEPLDFLELPHQIAPPQLITVPPEWEFLCDVGDTEVRDGYTGLVLPEAFFSRFDLCGGGEGPSAIDHTQAHWVWVGGALDSDVLKETIEEACSTLDWGTKVIWTDQREVSDEMKTYCRERKIKIVHVHDIFGFGGLMYKDLELFEVARTGLPQDLDVARTLLEQVIKIKFDGEICDISSPTDPVAITTPDIDRLGRRIFFDLLHHCTLSRSEYAAAAGVEESCVQEVIDRARLFAYARSS